MKLNVSILALAAIPLSWLLPNHYPPWVSAGQEGLALLLLFAAALFARRPVALPGLWVAAVGVAACSVVLQWGTGRVTFGGDVLMVLLYLAAFVLSIALGSTLDDKPSGTSLSALETVALGCLLSAIVSVGIALAQWTGSVSLGIWGADLPRGARPFANVAQPNHLSTLAFMGLCSLALLRETARVGATGFWLGATFFVAGMVMSVSRTGWLQVGAMVLLALVFQRRTASRLRAAHIGAIAALYAVGTLAWPWLNDVLLLSGGRGVTQQIEGGARGPLWLALLDAVTREPWWGYGWQQVAAAQQAVALDHPPVQRHFEHSHNIVLDLLLWAGIPVGGLIAALCATALFKQARALRDARALWLFAAVLGVVLHGMLELPLEYAYFLLPLGLCIGAMAALQPTGGLLLRVPVAALRLSGALLMALLLWVGTEYLQAEQAHRTLRLESARIGVSGIQTPPPQLRLLTQLDAFLRFAQTEAREGMTREEVAWMGQVSERFAYPQAMLRYALAAGLNGQPERAALTLARLCRIHPIERCREARQSWAALQGKFTVLRDQPPPALP